MDRNFGDRRNNGRNFGNRRMMEETLEMIEGTMKGTPKLRKTMRNKEMQLVNFEKNSKRHSYKDQTSQKKSQKMMRQED